MMDKKYIEQSLKTTGITNRKIGYAGSGLVLAVLSALNAILPPTAKAGFSGSKHDLLNGPDSCYLCHLTDNTGAINVKINSNDVYNSPTMDGKVDSLSALTLLCLSCHDGVLVSDMDITLTDSHPVSFDYEQSKNLDRGIKNTTLPLFEGRLECSTCHDVHNLSGYQKLLRMDNSGSKLCLDCHDK